MTMCKIKSFINPVIVTAQEKQRLEEIERKAKQLQAYITDDVFLGFISSNDKNFDAILCDIAQLCNYAENERV